MGRIPDRWEAYSALGRLISGTRFLAFKVPLKEVLCRQLPKEMWFTPTLLLEKVKNEGLELGLVIDLTNTKRYYQPEELTRHGIGYKKIFTEGHAVPSNTVKQNFFEAVDAFLEENRYNNRLIGVHCTHGLNRTGYLVCRYMIDRLKVSPGDAITAFNEARGYNIERENYLDDLKGASGSTSVTPVADDRGWRTDFPNSRVNDWTRVGGSSDRRANQLSRDSYSENGYGRRTVDAVPYHRSSAVPYGNRSDYGYSYGRRAEDYCRYERSADQSSWFSNNISGNRRRSPENGSQRWNMDHYRPAHGNVNFSRDQVNYERNWRDRRRAPHN